MTAACLAFAAVVYSPLAALTWTSALPSAKVLAAVAGLAVICTAVAFLLIFRLIAEVRPARQPSSTPTGSLSRSLQAGLWGPDDGRLSRPVLRAAGGEIPPPTHPRSDC